MNIFSISHCFFLIVFTSLLVIDVPLFAKPDQNIDSNPPNPMEEKTPEEILQQAENAYQYGDYHLAIKLYQSILHPNKIQKTRSRLTALTQLAICYYSNDKKDLARKEFEDVLKISPRHTLDPFLYPPQIILFFNETKRELAPLLVEIARVQDEEQKALKELKKAELKASEARAKQEQLTSQPFHNQVIEKIVYKNSLFLAVLPFGIGQFQNDDDTLGYFFFASQVIALSVNIGSYAYIVSLADEQGWYSAQNKIDAQSIQKIQLSAFYGFLSLWGISAAHGIMHFQETKPLQDVSQNPKTIKNFYFSDPKLAITQNSFALFLRW